MKIEFLASVAVITPDPPSSRRLYVDTLGLPFQDEGDSGYLHTEQLPGAKHFGIWPLSQAAEACFGEPRWPAHLPVPQASIEFDVADASTVQAAAEELVAAGHQLLHPARQEPWGQTVARLLSPEGTILGISYTPSMHE
jgi:catechol 2,3-dioxygenase-like lactoylglutathione lyase family enzyme